MKKELKNNIYGTVSTLRNLVNRMQVMLEEEIKKTQTEKENSALKTELEASRRENKRGKLETSTEREREIPKAVSRPVLQLTTIPVTIL